MMLPQLMCCALFILIYEGLESESEITQGGWGWENSQGYKTVKCNIWTAEVQTKLQFKYLKSVVESGIIVKMKYTRGYVKTVNHYICSATVVFILWSVILMAVLELTT